MSSKVVQVVEMNWQEFCQLPDHKAQRDTVARAEKNSSPGRHLSKPVNSHASVAAIVHRGRTYKLDGHTRAMLWNDGRLAPPCDIISVSIYEAIDETDYVRQYETFDNPVTQKNTKDKMFSALNLLGYEPRNILKSHNGVWSALRESTPGFGVKDDCPNTIVPLWLPEIKALDSIPQLANCKNFPTGFAAGFLMVHRWVRQKTRGDTGKVIEFFTKYLENDTNKSGSQFCPVHAMVLIYQDLKNNKETRHVNHMHSTSQKIFHCFRKYLVSGSEPVYTVVPKDSYTQRCEIGKTIKRGIRQWMQDNCDFESVVKNRKKGA